MKVAVHNVREERPDLRQASRAVVKSPSYLECHKVGYSINQKQILKDVDLVFPPGRLVALMGPSGAGKTTLLNVLAGRGNGVLEGDLKCNNESITRKMMRNISKMVPQHDVLTPVLTARETLQYTAKLALPPDEDHQAKVEEVLDMLSLTSCADVQCGGPDLKGLSGGQLKRVSIGMELLNNPSCLMLDEPTSGLDSKVAEDVVDLIKALAQGGRTVICTIHQPSYQVFEKFDWLVLLNLGKVAFNGPVDQLSGYLSEIGSPCPQFVNPADHVMQVLSEGVDALSLTDGVLSNSTDFRELFEASSVGNVARSDLQEQHSLLASQIEASSPTGAKKRNLNRAQFHTSWWSQMTTIFRRAMYVTFKDKTQLRTRMAQIIFIGLIISTIFLRMPNTQDRVNDRLSVIFLLILFLGMSSVMSTAMALPTEKSVFMREMHNGYYYLSAYYIGRISVLLTLQISYATILGSAVYFLLNFYPAAENFFIFILTLVIVSAASGVAGFIAGAIFPTPQAVSSSVPMIIMPLTIFAGLFIPLANIPVYWEWIYYISYFQWAIRIMMVNEFEKQELEACSLDEILNPTGTCPYGACSPNITDPQPCPGTVVLDRLDYSPDDIAMSFGIIFAFSAFLLLVGGLSLRRLVNKSH